MDNKIPTPITDDAAFEVAVGYEKDGSTLTALVVNIDTARELERKLSKWETELSEVMPADFKDWHQNNKSEWPLVAKLVIQSLREREAFAFRSRDEMEQRWKDQLAIHATDARQYEADIRVMNQRLSDRTSSLMALVEKKTLRERYVHVDKLDELLPSLSECSSAYDEGNEQMFDLHGGDAGIIALRGLFADRIKKMKMEALGITEKDIEETRPEGSRE
jgi:hypothetical protein